MKLNIRLMTILLTVAGSRAYGMATETSDVDMKGVAIPPKEYFFGFTNRFDQAEGDNILAFQDLLTAEEAEAVRETKLEGVVYSLQKFMGLAADANPNILDALFCRDEEVRLCTPLGAKLRENRNLFLSAKAKHTFSGYAAAQMKRLKNHRQWLVNPPKAPPQRSDFGLQERAEISKDQLAAIESTLRDRIASWDVDLTSVDMVEADRIKEEITRTLRERVVASDDVLAARSLGLNDNLVEVLVAERSFANASRSWSQYQEWQRSRNPERAALEAKFGYDCKFAMHLLRLLAMGREILTTGKVNVWRGGIDADFLLSVRRGCLTFDEVIERATTIDAELEALYRRREYVVPTNPDRVKLDALCVELVEASLV